MDKITIDRLNQLNKDFYSSVADSFNSSRNYYWKGWDEVAQIVKEQFTDKKIKVLDIGCGNGRFAQFLDEKGINFEYTGLDSSQKLLKWALEQVSLEKKVEFKRLDLIKTLQKGNFAQFLNNEKFDLIVSFGVLHHVPSIKLRKKLFINISDDLLNKNGIFVITAWLFLDNPKLKERTLNTQQIENLEINVKELEHNDYLLDWQRGKNAIRYCHYTDDKEVKKLTKNIDSTILKTYKADSKTNNLNQYYLFKKKK